MYKNVGGKGDLDRWYAGLVAILRTLIIETFYP